MEQTIPQFFYVKAVMDFETTNREGVLKNKVHRNDEFKVHYKEKTQEYFTTDGENREVFVGQVNGNGVVLIDDAFSLMPISQQRFDYIYKSFAG